MAKIIIDTKKIDEVLERGVEKIYPGKDELRKLLLAGKRLKFYCGFDPSAPSLHVGNAVLINKLSQFQELGHEVIFLIGDFTGMIGDPTDKLSARTKKTRKEVVDNAKLYKKQASVYLEFSGDNPAQVKYNSKWQDKINFKDLIELASNFTVQQMMVRDMYQERLKQEKPIYLHEFFYPLAQAYDSVVLDVDLEIGGNDQMFNMMCGRDLQKAINNKDKHVLTMKLLADDQGNKMGKSEGNAVFLNETPANMYGIIMSWPDGIISVGFELITKLPLAEVRQIQDQMKLGEINPRDLKMKLAYEITKLVHGDAKAKKAQKQFIKTFQKKEIPDDVRIIPSHAPKISIIDYLTDSGLATSRSDARRKIEQGGVYVDGKRVESVDFILDSESDYGKIIKVGKRNFVKIVF
jgi:tyrosyl-tRNA synthetase